MLLRRHEPVVAAIAGLTVLTGCMVGLYVLTDRAITKALRLPAPAHAEASWRTR